MKDINLMPREYIIVERRKKANMIFLGLGVILLIGIIIGVITPYRIINQKKQTLADLNQQLSSPKYDIIDIVNNELNTKEKEIAILNELIKTVDADSIISRTNLDIITGLLPPDTYIEKFSGVNDNNTYIIDGFSESSKAVSEYVVQLLNLPFIEDVKMTTETKVIYNDSNDVYTEEAIVQFKLEVLINGEKGAVDNNEEQIN